MADTSSIDLVALIEQHAAIRFGKAVSREEKQTRKGGPCPFCGLGEDRFAVFINEVPQHYYCGIHGNGCGAHGDALTFVREYLLIDNYYEACELLDIEPDSQYAGPTHRNAHTDEEPPCKKWQEQAELFCMQCKSLLWSDEGLPALNWLRARGLDDATINQAGLGLNLAQGHRDAKEWGEEKDLWIDRGIVIPWSVGGTIWKVNIRRSDKDIARENARLRAQDKKANAAKYRQVRGGTNGLYGIDLIQPGQPLVLVEGEFDCLATLQATDRQVAVVATGSTGSGRGQRWIEAIEQAEPILIAFDDDGNKAGDNAATFWDERISQAIRWTPWSHDINDMLLHGQDIPKWIALGRDVYQAMLTPVIPDEEPVCADCGAPITDESREYRFTNDGICYCSQCRSDAGQLVQSEPEPMTEERFMDIVQQIADVRVGGSAIYRDPPGYTIQDRARELAAIHKAEPQADFWAGIRAKVLRPPVDERGRPFYTPQEWAAKYEQLINQVPDPKCRAHLPVI